MVHTRSVNEYILGYNNSTNLVKIGEIVKMAAILLKQNGKHNHIGFCRQIISNFRDVSQYLNLILSSGHEVSASWSNG